MKSGRNGVLTINGGSSSIKFAIYENDRSLIPVIFGELENIGQLTSTFHLTEVNNNVKSSALVDIGNHKDGAIFIIDWLEKQYGSDAIKAIGHRIVHGMHHSEPELVAPALLDDLREISAYDPEHLPAEISLIETFQHKYPAIPQIACFDTAFHSTMPIVARMLPIPRRYMSRGIHRYGFHGLSYAFLLEELALSAGSETAHGKIIMAHLGNGASMVAVHEGKSVDTSMGFTPTGGLLMGTRTGDLDPGVALYVMRNERLTPEQFSHLINHESGLLGTSETSSDMRELLSSQSSDTRAAEAIHLFSYQAKKWIGAYAAALGGLDTLIFTGGIGAHSPEIRRRICQGLQFLGIEVDEIYNEQNASIISTREAKVCVRVIKTNEELMIARLVCRVLKYPVKL